MLKENGRKENGRLIPADKQEFAEIFGKAFRCTICQQEFKLKGVEFGGETECPICGGLAQEVTN